MFYVVELNYNESAECANERNTANFEIPKALQKFDFYSSSMKNALAIAHSFLLGLTECKPNEVAISSFSDEYVRFAFPNFKDDLEVCYTITRKPLKPYYFVTHLPQPLQDLILYRLKENDITNEEDIEHALNSRLCDLEDAINITDILSGEAINKCTFCGKIDFANTITVSGYTILESCETCEEDIKN